MSTLLKSAQRRLSDVRQMKTELIKDANAVVSTHWDFIKFHNARIRKQLNRGDKAEKPGAVAPYLKKGKTFDEKVYIYWCSWRFNPKAKGNERSIQSTLTPYARGYTSKFFIKHCEPWLASQATEAEAILKPIRDELDALQNYLTSLKRIIRQIENQTEKDNG